MKFWDSSAIVPLCLDQKPEHTRLARSLFDDDEDLVVWWGTVVECASAFDRLRRTGGISDIEQRDAMRNLLDMREDWNEVVPSDRVQARAIRAVTLHSLTATDSLQLAAALEWSEPAMDGHFVTFDQKLHQAAHTEGFMTYPSPGLPNQ